ncbi:MMPL family transporter [Streptomyces sp. GZWMJZ-114]|uniref:MMPL family transporter n=1 Tax=unclassified Streptomyces TaxID=2593676 RepID=UPI0013E932CF|nr:MMPL family transporter [Streptomyces sp. GZWMJZ-114]
MAQRLYALGRWAARRRGRVLAVWLLLLAVAVGLGTTLSGKLSTEFSVPGIESQEAQDLLKEKFPEAAGGTARVVFEAPKGDKLTGAKEQRAIGATLKKVAAVPGVLDVADPTKTGTVSKDRTIAYADAVFGKPAQDVPQSAKDKLDDALDPARDAGLKAELGGTVSTPPVEVGGPAEVIGIVIAFVVLAVTLGSLLAAGLPLLTAVIGVGVGVMTVQFLSRFIEMTNTATILALMIGLAVGIDYALFLVSRHREQLADPDEDVHDSIGRATATAGSAVTFAGVTVIIALAALASAGIPFLTVMGLAAAGTVLVAVLVALTLVPALLGFLGERLRPKAKQGGTAGAADTEGAAGATGKPGRGRVPGAWGLAWGRLMTRFPIPVLVVCVVGMLALAVPAKSLRLGLPSNETQPTASTQHKSYELLQKGFGPGFNATLLIAVDGTKVPAKEREGIVKQVAATVQKDPDVATLAPPDTNKDGTLTVLGVVPKSGPDDQRTTDLVHRLRDEATKPVDRAGGTAYVAGQTAAGIDVSAKLSGALPLFIAIIVVLALLLLMIAFRSVLVPLKAVLGFLLSIAASLGAVVWVFQYGHLDGIFQVAAAAPIVSFLPVLLIGVLFGLAMDYEVFLVSRMREHYHHHRDARAAVEHGVERSGRVVTAAALIMASVFGGFIFNHDPIIKSIGFALTIGVLLDAFVVRLTVVPAVLALLGRYAWALPRWLDKAVPNVDIEGDSLPPRPGTGGAKE